MEDDKRGDRNLAKAEAARRLARFQQGTFWIGTERILTKRCHYNLVLLHARRKTFPAFTANCTFSGVVPINLKRFTDSGISLVECPESYLRKWNAPDLRHAV